MRTVVTPLPLLCLALALFLALPNRAAAPDEGQPPSPMKQIAFLAGSFAGRSAAVRPDGTSYSTGDSDCQSDWMAGGRHLCFAAYEKGKETSRVIYGWDSGAGVYREWRFLASYDLPIEGVGKMEGNRLVVDLKLPSSAGVGLIAIPASEGLYAVSRVAPGSAAGKAGLKPGDVVTRLEGRAYRFATAAEFTAALRGPLGSALTLTVRRDGAEREVSLTRQALPGPPGRITYTPDPKGGFHTLTEYDYGRGFEKVSTSDYTPRERGFE